MEKESETRSRVANVQKLSPELGRKVQSLIERIVANSDVFSGSTHSESSEDSESSEGSETSEGSEDKESSEMALLREALSVQPDPSEWGAMLGVVEQLANITHPGRAGQQDASLGGTQR